MRQAQGLLRLRTPGQGLHPFTDRTAAWVADQGIATGLLTLFCRHTSASLLIQENASPAVGRDLSAWFAALAPEGTGYEHDDEGPDDMPAHLRTAVTPVSLAVPVAGGRLALGTWQGLFLFEHRRAPHTREVVLHLLGE